MKEVKVNRQELLDVLRKNRTKHGEIFAEALEGYKAKVIETLERTLAQAKAGERVAEYIQIPKPVNQTHEYNRAIRMMEMCVEAVVALTEEDFESYVMDRWAWKTGFLSANSIYSKAAADTLAENMQF